MTMTRYTSIWSLASAHHVATFQRFCGLHSVNGKIVVRSRLAFWTFTLGAKLGYELFYTLAFSFCFWHLDSWLCRRLMLVWGVIMYIGQALKEIIKIPRPTGQGVIVLEPEYSLEYGLPSTHAVLALSMPIALAFNLSGRYEFSMFLFIIISTLWCLIICASRIYLGMHSILDLITGLALTCLLIGPILQHLDSVDRLLIHCRWSPIILIVLITIAGFLYPEPRPGSPSRGDTCTIIAGTAGVYLGVWLLYRQAIIQDYSLSLIFETTNNSDNSFLLIFCRSLLGLVVMVLARISGKVFAKISISYFFMIDINHKDNRFKRSIEVPTKLITYTLVGFMLAYNLAVFNLFNLGRHRNYYEA